MPMRKNSFQNIKSVENSTSLQPADSDFVETSMALLCLIRWIEEKDLGIILDRKKRRLIDETEIGEKSVIFDENRARSFFDWLDAQASLSKITSQKN
jgi:hypothetical protein